ncbi:hypothetical protein [Catenovulum sediminis]|uniref:Uncharacterized protein n=1 Tax=Catenovulum sediminis TaxID=1740262 RepID=A0ABV1RHJ5_9ALTE
MNTVENSINTVDVGQDHINRALDAISAKQRLIKAPYRIVLKISGDVFKFRLLRNELCSSRVLISAKLNLSATDSLYRLAVINQMIDEELSASEVAA